MTLYELKNKVLENTLGDELLIFLCQDNTFVARQYIDQICKAKILNRYQISDVASYVKSPLSMVFSKDMRLAVLQTDTFGEVLEAPETLENIIILCNKLDKKVKDTLEPWVIKFPKLLDWQMADYVKAYSPLLPDSEVEELINLCNHDIYRLNNELHKLTLFPASEHRAILAEIKAEEGTNLCQLSSFALAEAICKHDIQKITNYFKHRANLDLEPLSLVGLLLKDYKKILYIILKSGLNAQSLGITQKQYNAIAYYHRDYTQAQIKDIIRFLTSIDFRLKSGKLELQKDYFIDYIINKIFQFLANK